LSSVLFEGVFPAFTYSKITQINLLSIHQKIIFNPLNLNV